MNLKFDNQLALVTASTGGIGLEIARSLALEGARAINILVHNLGIYEAADFFDETDEGRK
jgi:NAD(P)-dependent dehydrogenase (short-subunit alcohol dehydrogenase family)